MRALLPILVSFVALCTPACSSKLSSRSQVGADITVQNDSTNHLDWAEVEWGDRSISVGVMPPGKGATFLDFDLPSDVRTNVAVIKCINEDTPGLSWDSGSNDEVRARRATSWTRIPVDVRRLLQLGDGHYDVTFRILSLTNADVLVERRENR